MCDSGDWDIPGKPQIASFKGEGNGLQCREVKQSMTQVLGAVSAHAVVEKEMSVI